MTRHARIVDEDGRVGGPAEDVLAGRQADFAVSEDDPARCRDVVGARGPRLGRDVAAEDVAVAMDRLDEPRRARLVDALHRERPLARQEPPGGLLEVARAGQAQANMVAYNCAKAGIEAEALEVPQSLQDLVEQQFQQPQQLGARMHDGSLPRELTTLPVERAVAKDETHTWLMPILVN